MTALRKNKQTTHDIALRGQAAVLDVKLKYLDGWHEARRKNAALYNKLLAGSKVISTPPVKPQTRSNNTSQKRASLAPSRSSASVVVALTPPIHSPAQTSAVRSRQSFR